MGQTSDCKNKRQPFEYLPLKQASNVQVGSTWKDMKTTKINMK
jgi:hypothetical protein